MLTHKQRVKIICKRYHLNAAEASQFVASEIPRQMGKENFRTEEKYNKYLDELEELGK